MKKFAYYPGCSASGTSKGYEKSLLQVFEKLDTVLTELDDWNCCGATLEMDMNDLEFYVLNSRNLVLAEKEGNDVVVPCNACYVSLLKTQYYLRNYPDIREKIDQALASIDLEYKNSVEVLHPLEVIVRRIGTETVKEKMESPLKGFKIAPYYGCLLTRPYDKFDDTWYPETMDNLLEELGGEVIDYPFKTRCCGGLQGAIDEEIGMKLNYIILKEAEVRGANVISVTCPFCHLNLEIQQNQILKNHDLESKIPIFYFTQLMGLTMGIPNEKLGVNQMMISPKVLLAGW